VLLDGEIQGTATVTGTTDYSSGSRMCFGGPFFSSFRDLRGHVAWGSIHVGGPWCTFGAAEILGRTIARDPFFMLRPRDNALGLFNSGIPFGFSRVVTTWFNDIQ
jgi:hypothetical protein